MVDETILRQLRDIAIMYPRHAEYVQQGIATIEALQQEVARLKARDAEQGQREYEYHRATTCPCTAAERYMPDCPKHGARTALQNGASNGR